MGARTGSEYLAGLRDSREVWLEGKRVDDVTAHPKLAGAAQTLASLFDLQHDLRELCLQDDGEGGSVALSHMIPRSRSDLERRHAALEAVASATVGLMGRTPDYLNVTFAGFAGRSSEWRAEGNDEGADRLVAFQRELACRDLALTHTIIHPTVDKSLGDAVRPDNDVVLRKVGETANGIVVRGAKVLATLAPFSDEIAVYPAHPIPEGSEAFAVSFSVPMATPGLRVLCRDSVASEPGSFDHPLSSRFDEQDAFVIFDDVEVPWGRVFLDGNLAVYNNVMRTSWFPNVAQQTMIRAHVKLEFAYGLACRMAEAINDTSPATAEMLGELWSYAEFTRAAIRTAEVDARDYGDGVWFPAPGPMNALRAQLPRWFPRVNEVIRLIGSHNLLVSPAAGEFDDPGLRPLIDHYVRGAKDVPADRRAAIFRLAWDFTGSALASRNEQYERFYLASAARCYQIAHASAHRDRAFALVEQFLPER
jgi:4-hydroxyphenylacetate 3-monooxygenase oxygenase component